MFTKDKLIEEFFEIIKNDDKKAFQWFKDLNRQYKELKKSKQLNDDIMFELTEFIIIIDQMLGNEFMDWLEYSWGNNAPTLINDVAKFIPKHSKMVYEKYIEKMGEFEKEETRSLYEAILDKNQRADLNGQIYDWDKDEDRMISLSINKNITEISKYELMSYCANVIYNRGAFIIRFYSKRGEFELVGINAQNGKGEWSCFSKDEVAAFYEDGLRSNEKVINLPKQSKKIEYTNNVIPFRRN